MRSFLPILAALALLLLGLDAHAQILAPPACTIAAGPQQVVTEGGDCGKAEQGFMVKLIDATSVSDCGADAGGSSGAGTKTSLCAYNSTIGHLEALSGSGGSLPSGGSLSDDDVTALHDVSGHLGTTGVLRDSVNENATTGDAVCYDVNDNLSDCGVPPSGGDVEAHSTSCPSGDGYTSNGSTSDCTDLATQAELDAVVNPPVTSNGTYVQCDVDGSAASNVNWNGSAEPSLFGGISRDALGQWELHDFDGDGDDEACCYVPPQTQYIDMSTDWDNGTTPGTDDVVVSITGHAYGTATSVLLKMGRTGTSENYPSCSPSLLAAAGNDYFAVPIDANSFKILKDVDADGVPEPGTDDDYLKCTTMGTATWLTLQPADPDDVDKAARFSEYKVTANLLAAFVSATGTPDIQYWVKHSLPPFEGTDPVISIGHAITSVGAGSYDMNDQGTIDLPYGECLTALGYATDTMSGRYTGGTVIVEDAGYHQAAPIVCAYTSDSVIASSCLHGGIVTNRGASGTVNLTMPPVTAGMSATFVNEATGPQTMTVDPDGKERWQPPLTDTDGDKVSSSAQGDTLQFYAPADGALQATFYSAGWTDAN